LGSQWTATLKLSEEIHKEIKMRKVVVTTDQTRRGVFFGELESYDVDKQTCTLKNARMAIYWSTETKGVLGLASIGPQTGSRISPPVPQIELNGVTSVMDTTEIAVSQWEKGIWN
jgi:hypothetical protein